MTIKRRCNNCHELYEGRHCPECTKKMMAKSDKRRLEKDDHRRIYKTRLWEKCRKTVRLRYSDYDIWLLAVGVQRVCVKPYIHHIIPRDEDPDLAFDLDNLITVTKESHEQIHQWYKTDRAAAMARIHKGIKKWQSLRKKY